MAQRRRHTPEQIVRKLREADRPLAEGAAAAALAPIRLLNASKPAAPPNPKECP